jgi:prevent-host-death family protein
MRQVQLDEQEQQFASLIAEAEAGESLTILRRGKPVAQIVPFPKQLTEAERAAAIERLSASMEKGLDLGGVWNGRDELYDRLQRR